MDEMTEFVSVPKALLLEVLNNATRDSYAVEGETCCSEADFDACEEDREKIDRLIAAASTPRP